MSVPLRNGVSASVVVVPPGQWPHLLDFLSQRLPGISRSEWADRCAQGLVLQAHGQIARADQPCLAGQRYFYYRHVANELPLPKPATVIFEDEHLLVADKPHFMPVTPSGRYVQQCLLVQLKRLTGLSDLVPLHRIDRETAGVVLFGKRPQDRNAYQSLFRDRKVDKVYEAVAPWREDLVFPLTRQSHILEDAQAFYRMREALPHEGLSPNSETRIECVQRAGERALYRLFPVSGKRHQLRVHMLGLGLPIEGDQFYPLVRRGPDEAEDFAQPLQLLAKSIAFTDPVTTTPRHFESCRQLDM